MDDMSVHELQGLNIPGLNLNKFLLRAMLREQAKERAQIETNPEPKNQPVPDRDNTSAAAPHETSNDSNADTLESLDLPLTPFACPLNRAQLDRADLDAEPETKRETDTQQLLTLPCPLSQRRKLKRSYARINLLEEETPPKRRLTFAAKDGADELGEP